MHVSALKKRNQKHKGGQKERTRNSLIFIETGHANKILYIMVQYQIIIASLCKLTSLMC